MPDLRHDSHRARGSSASGRRRVPSQIARPPTSSVPRPQALRRGNPGRAFDCTRTCPTQTTRGAPAEKRRRAAEICCLCHRAGRAGWGGLPVRAILAEQDTGQREFQAHPSCPRRQQRWGWPAGRSERRNGRLGHSGRRLLITTAPGQSPTTCGRPRTNGPRRQPRGRIYERRLAGEVQTARAKRSSRRRAAIERPIPAAGC
jgi:hypothetical protein